MKNCIAQAIKQLGRAFTYERRRHGSYKTGRWVDETPELFEAFGAIMPAKPNDLLRLEEGRRTSAAIKVFTTTELRTADAPKNIQPDIIQYRNERWQVDSVEDWFEIAGFFKILATKVGQ